MADLVGKRDVSVSSRGVVIQEWTYDFDADGGAIGALDVSALGEDIVIHRAWFKVLTACTSAGAATVSLGSSGTSADNLVGATAVASLTANAVIDEAATPLNVYLASADVIQVAIAAAALTAGKIRICLEMSQFDES